MTGRLFLTNKKIPGPTASKIMTSKLQELSCMNSYATRFKYQCSRLRRKKDTCKSKLKFLLYHANERETMNYLIIEMAQE